MAVRNKCTHTSSFTEDGPKTNNVIHSVAGRWKATQEPWRGKLRESHYRREMVDEIHSVLKLYFYSFLDHTFFSNCRPTVSSHGLPLIFYSQSASWTWCFCPHPSRQFCFLCLKVRLFFRLMWLHCLLCVMDLLCFYIVCEMRFVQIHYHEKCTQIAEKDWHCNEKKKSY